MALYLLYESASGYALFLAHGLDEIGQNTEAVRNSVSDLNRFGKVVQLTAFHPFESALDALNQCNAISEGELPKTSIPLGWLLVFRYSSKGFLGYYLTLIFLLHMKVASAYVLRCLLVMLAPVRNG